METTSTPFGNTITCSTPCPLQSEMPLRAALSERAQARVKGLTAVLVRATVLGKVQSSAGFKSSSSGAAR